MGDRKGYLLALLAALAGGFVPAFALSAGTVALVSERNVALGLFGFVAATLVAWVGAPLGVWAALTLGKQPHAGGTALLLIAVLSLSWLALTPLAFSDIGLTVLNVSVAFVAPLAARRLATWRRIFPASPQAGSR